MTRGVHG